MMTAGIDRLDGELDTLDLLGFTVDEDAALAAVIAGTPAPDYGELAAALWRALMVGPATELPHIDTRPSWQRLAACRGQPAAWWFDPAQSARGLAVCERCPVRARCLEWALSLGPELEGIFGGTLDHERRRLLRDAG